MFVYRLSDLYSKLDELKNAGFEYVDLMESRPDSDGKDVPYISFEGITMEDSSVDFEEVDSVILPEGYYFEY